jgi:hypothetical protein
MNKLVNILVVSRILRLGRFYMEHSGALGQLFKCR